MYCKLIEISSAKIMSSFCELIWDLKHSNSNVRHWHLTSKGGIEVKRSAACSNSNALIPK